MKNKNRIYLVLGLLALCQSPLHANPTTEDINALTTSLQKLNNSVDLALPTGKTAIEEEILLELEGIDPQNSEEALETIQTELTPALKSLNDNSTNLGTFLKICLARRLMAHKP
jgi:hypothetical protein